MDKKNAFRAGRESVKKTYADVSQMFNGLNGMLHGETYVYSDNLKHSEGGKAIGFEYTGYAAGVGLRNILDSIGVKYTTLMLGGSGVNESSQILIKPESEERMKAIAEKISMDYRIYSDHDTMIAKNPLSEQIR